MIHVTRVEAGDEIARLIRHTRPAVAATEIMAYLEKHGAHFQADAMAPCRHCGKPWDTKSCAVAGCPLGADL